MKAQASLKNRILTALFGPSYTQPRTPDAGYHWRLAAWQSRHQLAGRKPGDVTAVTVPWKISSGRPVSPHLTSAYIAEGTIR